MVSGQTLVTRLDDHFHWDVLAPIAVEAIRETAARCDIPVEALGKLHWVCLDWEDHKGDAATGTRIRLVFPYHQTPHAIPLPLDPSSDTNLLRAHELAALVETTFDIDRARNSDKTRKRLTVKGMALDNLEICSEKLPVSPGVGTRLWVDLRGYASPRLTADRKTAMPREDVENWPSVFHGILQRWCGWLQELLDQHSSNIAPGLLLAFAIKPGLRPKAPATPRIHNWQLNTTYRGSDWSGRWLTALLTQEFGCISDFPRDHSFEHTGAYGRGLSLAFQPQPHDLERDPACILELSINKAK